MIVEDSMKDTFTTKDVLKIFNMEWGRLRTWIKTDFLTPSTPPKGQGKAFEFTQQDIYALAIFKKLVDDGTSRATASKVYLRVLPLLVAFTVGGLEFPPYLLIEIKDEDVTVKHSTSLNMAGMFTDKAGWEVITVINLKAIKKSIDNKLKELEE